MNRAMLALVAGLAATPAAAQQILELGGPDEPGRPGMATTRSDSKRLEAAREDVPISQTTFGPARIPLSDQGALTLPQGFHFVAPPAADALAAAAGRTNSRPLLGVILRDGEKPAWVAELEFVADGHVKVEGAKSRTAGALLPRIRAAADRAAEDRARRGHGKVEIRSWVQEPSFDAAKQRLVFATTGGDGSTDLLSLGAVVLNRDGHFNFEIHTSAGDRKGLLADFTALLAGLSIDPAKAYDKFNPAIDRPASYGLAEIVGGIDYQRAKARAPSLLVAHGSEPAKPKAVDEARPAAIAPTASSNAPLFQPPGAAEEPVSFTGQAPSFSTPGGARIGIWIALTIATIRIFMSSRGRALKALSLAGICLAAMRSIHFF